MKNIEFLALLLTISLIPSHSIYSFICTWVIGSRDEIQGLSPMNGKCSTSELYS